MPHKINLLNKNLPNLSTFTPVAWNTAKVLEEEGVSVVTKLRWRPGNKNRKGNVTKQYFVDDRIDIGTIMFNRKQKGGLYD